MRPRAQSLDSGIHTNIPSDQRYDQEAKEDARIRGRRFLHRAIPYIDRDGSDAEVTSRSEVTESPLMFREPRALLDSESARSDKFSFHTPTPPALRKRLRLKPRQSIKSVSSQKSGLHKPYCPVHNPRMRRSDRIGSAINLPAKTEHSILAGTYGEHLKQLVRERIKQGMSHAQTVKVVRERRNLKINVFVMSISLMFVASAFEGIQNLQTSINSKGNMGSICLAAIYVGSFGSCLFLPSYFLDRLGCKRTLAVCILVGTIYMIVNFHPNWFSLMPASILYGIFDAPMHAAKDAYIGEIGARYAKLNFEETTDVVNRFIGHFFAIHYLGKVVGNIISSKIIYLMVDEAPLHDRIEMTCGHFYDPNKELSEIAAKNLQRPPDRAISSICGIYLCCSIVAMIFLANFMQKISLEDQSEFRSTAVWSETLQHLRKRKHLFLIPLTVYNGMEKAFLAGLYTRAYVGCCLGIAGIGYVMAMFGVCSALCSVLFGPLFKLFGRLPLFMFGAVTNILMIFTLMIWPPNPGDQAMFYVVAATWGMADGVWNTQICGLYADLFDKKWQPAVANHRLFESIGFVLTYMTIPYVSTETWLFALLSCLLVGLGCYGAIEVWQTKHVQEVRGRILMFKSIGFMLTYMTIPYVSTETWLFALLSCLLVGLGCYGAIEVWQTKHVQEVRGRILMFKSIGFVLTYMTIPYVSTETWLFALLSCLLVGLGCYGAIEVWQTKHVQEVRGRILMFKSIGFMLTYMTIPYVSTETWLFALLSCLLVGLGCYGAIEVWQTKHVQEVRGRILMFKSIGFVLTYMTIPYVSTETWLFALLSCLLVGLGCYGAIEVWQTKHVQEVRYRILMFKSIGFVLTYMTIPYVSTETWLFALLSCLLVGLGCYGAIEVWQTKHVQEVRGRILMFKSIGFVLTYMTIPYVSTETWLFALLSCLLVGLGCYGAIEVWQIKHVQEVRDRILMFKSIGFVLTYMTIPYVSTETWLFTLLSCLLVGLGCYGAIEVWQIKHVQEVRDRILMFKSIGFMLTYMTIPYVSTETWLFTLLSCLLVGDSGATAPSRSGRPNMSKR